jgi:hypothetical protein
MREDFYRVRDRTNNKYFADSEEKKTRKEFRASRETSRQAYAYTSKEKKKQNRV